MKIRHDDEYKFIAQLVRKQLLKKCGEAKLLASLPDTEDVIDTCIPLIMKWIMD